MKSHVRIRGSILFGKSPDPCRDSFYLFNPLSKEVCLRRTLIGHCQSRAMSASLIGQRLQTTHHRSVDVAHGLALLFGIGTEAPSMMGFEDEVEQSFGRPCRHSHKI